MGFAGQGHLAIGSGGALLIDLGGRTLRQPPPRATQLLGGRPRLVASRYLLRGDGRVGLAVGPYDHARPLRIDPKLLYATYLAEGIQDPARDIAVDRFGSAYITGETDSSQLPVTKGALEGKVPSKGQSVSYVTKLSPDGRRMIYSTYLGGRAGAFANTIAVDRQGAAYVGGMAYPGGIATTPGALLTQPLGDPVNGFVAKLAPSGRRLVYSTYIAGSGTEGGQVNAIAVDSQGDAYLTGETDSLSFPVTPGSPQAPGLAGTTGASPDDFIAKLNPAGSQLLYAATIGGSGWDRVGGIAIDAAGAAYIAGATEARDLPVTPGAFQAVNRAEDLEFENGYVAKLDPSGQRFDYVTYLGGTFADELGGIAVDSAGRAYVTGGASSDDYPTTAGASQRRPKGFESAIVSVISPNGTRLLRSTVVGKETRGRDITLDRAGNVYLVGLRDAQEHHGVNRGYRGFLAELNPGLTKLRLWQGVGGQPARASALALSGNGDVYVVGGSGPGMRTTNTLSPRIRGNLDFPSAFVTKLRP